MKAVKSLAVLGAIALSCTVAACGGGDQASAPAATPQTTQWDPEDPELTLEEAEAMMAAFEEQTGAGRNDILVKSIMYNPNGGLTVDAVDPKAPTELNQYVSNIYNDRNEVRPYDYGGAEKYEDLKATLFPANQVTPEMAVTMFNDSFNHVQGDRSELRAKWLSVSQDLYGVLGVTVANGTDRDQQTVLYDPAGQFIKVS